MAEIRNCEFRFKCPMQWEALKPTDHEDQRYCGECNQLVYFCHIEEELMAAIKADRCVAIEQDAPEEGPFVVGMMKSKYNVDQ